MHVCQLFSYSPPPPSCCWCCETRTAPFLSPQGPYRPLCLSSQNTTTGNFTIQMMDTGAEKLEMTAGAIEPVFNDYLTEFLQSIPDTKGSRVFLAR